MRLESRISTVLVLSLCSTINIAIADQIEPDNFVNFPLKKSNGKNTNNACSIKQLEGYLKRWSGNVNRGKSKIVQVSENYCFDALEQKGDNYTVQGLVVAIPNGNFKAKNMIYQKICSFRCAPGYRFVDETGAIKGPLYDLTTKCNSKPYNKGGRMNHAPAHWKVMEHYKNFECKFSGEEEPSFTIKASQIQPNSTLLQTGRLGSMDMGTTVFGGPKINPSATVKIPPKPCQFKRYLKLRNALFKYPLTMGKSEHAFEAMKNVSELYDIHIIEDVDQFDSRMLPHGYEYRILDVPGYYMPMAVVFRGDWLKLTKSTFEGTRDVEIFDDTKVAKRSLAMHFQRKKSRDGLMRTFTVIYIRDFKNMHDLDILSMTESLRTMHYPVNTIIFGNLKKENGKCINLDIDYLDSDGGHLHVLKGRRWCDHAIAYGTMAVRSSCRLNKGRNIEIY